MSSQGRFNRWLTGYERLGKFITTTVVIVGLVSAGVAWIAYRIHGRTVQVWIPIALFFGLIAFNVLFVAFALARRPGAIDEADVQARLDAAQAGLNDLQQRLDAVETEVSSDEYRKRLLYDCLESIQQGIASETDWELDAVVERGILGTVRGLLTSSPAEDVRLAVLIPQQDDDTRWSMRWAEGHRPESVQKYDWEIDRSIAGIAYRRDEIINIPDVREDPRFEANPKETRPYAAQFAMPLRIGERIVGAFSVVSTAEGAFSPTDVSFLKIVGAILDVMVTLQMDIKRWVAYAMDHGYEPDADRPEAKPDWTSDPFRRGQA